MNRDQTDDIIRFAGLVAVIAGLMLAGWMLYGG
jgi:uncharacterized protein YjeT (DUF2065 family)